MKTILSFLSCLFVFSASYSQVNLQVYGSFVRNLNPDYRTNTKGGGIRFEIAKPESSITKYFGAAYNLPMYTLATLEAQAMSSATDPSHVNVTARYKQAMIRLEGGGAYYLAGEGANFDGFNWSLHGGVEAVFIQNKPTYSHYDKEKYTLGYTDDSDVNPDGTGKFDIHLFLTAGTGVEKNLGYGNIFLQAAIAFPVTNVGGSNVASGLEDFTPIPLNINLGYKIPLGGK